MARKRYFPREDLIRMGASPTVLAFLETLSAQYQLEDDVDSVTTDLTDLQTSVTTLQTDVDALETEMDQVDLRSPGLGQIGALIAQAIASAPSTLDDVILLEDGDFLLIEDGNFLQKDA